ncbi:MAG: type III polyketide synthase [Isosphaeraceae bacterium]
MTPVVLGIGTAVPALRLTRSESVDAAKALCAEEDDHAVLLENLYRQAGVEARYSVHSPAEFRRVVYGEGVGEVESIFLPKGKGDRGPSTGERMIRYERESVPLAERACRAAMEDAGVGPDEFTHVVTASCTGFSAPGVDIALIKGLGLPATVERTHVGFMGCHGALNALRVARGLIASEPRARVLLCSVELSSLHYAYGWDPKKVVGNALFADGAGALVLGVDPSPSADAWRLSANGACLFPNSEFAMAWFVRDHGFDMVLSSKVPNLIQRNLAPWLDSWLARHGLTTGEVTSWAIHPGGPRVLNCVQEALGIPAEATAVSRTVLENYGNMSSATVLFILERLIKSRTSRPCVALGFGPGLAAEAALFA